MENIQDDNQVKKINFSKQRKEVQETTAIPLREDRVQIEVMKGRKEPSALE